MDERRVGEGDDRGAADVAGLAIEGERTRTALIELLLLQVRQTGYANCALITFVGVVMRVRFDGSHALLWMVSGYLLVLSRAAVFDRIRKRAAREVEHSRLEAAVAVSMVLSGLHWGAAVWLFLDPEDAYKFSFLTAAVLGVISAALSTHSTRPLIWFLFAATICGVSVVKMLIIGHWLLAMMSAMVLVTFTALSRSLGVRIAESVTQDLRNARLLVEVRRAKERADRANREKSLFMAATSHDLRQPLHAQSLLLDVLAERAKGGELDGLVDRVVQSNAALNSLFDALLEVSQLDAGAVKVYVGDHPLRELCRLVADEFREVANRKALTMEVTGEDRVVLSDPVLLARVLRNLVSNAIKFTDAGGVEIRIHDDPGSVRLSVIDTGIGVAESEHETIFGEFAQLNNASRDRSQGIGLGLALVRRLCALLDHPVSIESGPGRGARFTLSLREGDRSRVVPAQEELPTRKIPDLDVMIIDDERPVLDAMQAVFACWSFRTRAFTSARSAMAALDGDGYRPDLILSDYRLDEVMTGSEAIGLLRERLGEKVPAILISGDTDPHLLEQFHEEDFHLLHKPLKASRLKKVIATLVDTPAAIRPRHDE